MAQGSEGAQSGPSSSLSIPSSSTQNQGTASSASASSITDPNTMAIAPYVPPSTSHSILQDLNLPFTNDASLWDFTNDSSGDAGIPFISGSQLDMRHPNASTSSLSANQQQPATLPGGLASVVGPNNSGESSGNDPSPPAITSAPQMPSHVAKNNPFLNKLRSMVDDPATNELICWSPDGETFLVPNHIRFGDEVLPRFFKHNRFSSFVRQLNMYGFHKVPHLQQGALKADNGQENELWEFRNDNFKRDHPELLLNMQRKKGVRNDDDQKERERDNMSVKEKDREENEGKLTTLDEINGALMRNRDGNAGAMQLASVWSAIQSIQAAQQGINDSLRHLHTSNSELFREATEQRARSKKQEDTINKMLRFLAGVFGAQDVGGLGSNDRGNGERGGAEDPNGQGGKRRVVIRPTKGKRLMIGDSNMADDDQIETLELPLEDDASIEELTPHNRFSEARSNTNSPKEATTPSQRFTNLQTSPLSRENDLPNISSEVTATPGGGRRISQQAGSQILSALASGEGSAWLASLFGQNQNQQAHQSSEGGNFPEQAKAAATPGGGSFKLDPQTLSTLQSVLGNINAGDNNPNQSYFDRGGAVKDDEGRFTYPWNGSSSNLSTGQAQSNSGSSQPWAAAASKGQPGSSNSQHDSSQVVATPYADQLAKSIQKNNTNLQGTSQDAAMVQNALNALVDGMRIEPNALSSTSGNSGIRPNDANPHLPSSGTLSSTTDQVERSTGDTHSNAGGEADMESFLREFLNSSGSTGTPTTPGAYDGSGEAPADHGNSSFAFSPLTTSFGQQNGESKEDVARPIDQITKNIHTPASSNVSRSGTNTPEQSDSPSTQNGELGTRMTRKRKPPAEFEGALGPDIEKANARAVKTRERRT